MLNPEKKIAVIEIIRSKDNKIVTLSQLIEYCKKNENKIDDPALYSCRHREEDEKSTLHMTGSQLKRGITLSKEVNDKMNDTLWNKGM